MTEEHLRLLTRAAKAKERAHAAVVASDDRLARAIMTAWSEGGYSYQAIGEVVGLTKQRVDQIIRAHKP
jgi:predicted transcriptional regulator